MNSAFSKLTLPLLAALALGTGCRQTEILGPAPTPAPAGMGAGGMGAAAGTGAAPAGSAVATLTGFMGGTVTGTATFTKATGTDVAVTVALANCVMGKIYPVHIHEGMGCADAVAQGEHWGPTRGEGIPSVTCTGTTGTSTVVRPALPANTAWTIGGTDVMSNVVGHAFVVHAPDMPVMPARIACGVITLK